MNSKTWWKSKTLWMNLIAFAALGLQTQTGFIIDAESQAGILAVINLILRAVTYEALDWSMGNQDSGQAGSARVITLLILFAISIAMFTVPGCATKGSMSTGTNSAVTAVTTAQQAANQTLYIIGSALKATPDVVEALYTSGKITKEQYNSVVPTYNQALASYILAVDALEAATAAGKDPGTTAAYATALATFMVNKTNLDNLLVALGGQKIGTGVQ